MSQIAIAINGVAVPATPRASVSPHAAIRVELMQGDELIPMVCVQLCMLSVCMYVCMYVFMYVCM
jgi:hypothetical protein